MSGRSFILSFILSAGAFSAFVPAPAYATSNRTFVSALGNDANPCSITQPCRTMQAAFNVTTAGGEIEVLDPSGYGTLTITHAINIHGHGWASMNTTTAVNNVITISAGPSDQIVLRGLIVEGLGIAGDDIFFSSGGSLIVTDSVIQNAKVTGIAFAPNGSATLSVANTRVTGNQTGPGIRVFAGPSGAVIRGSIEHVVMDHNHSGFELTGGDTITVNFALHDCALTNNINNGILASLTSNTMVQNSIIAANAIGIQATSGAVVRITRTAITGNDDAFSTNAGSVLSYGDNAIDGNTTNEAPTSMITSPR